MNLKLFSFTFLSELYCSLNFVCFPHFSHDSAALCYTGVGTVPNKQNFAPTAKRCVEDIYIVFIVYLLWLY